MSVKPFKDEPGSRKEQVKRMFDSIAGRYDFLNHLLSFNVDKKWRGRLLRLIKEDILISGKDKPILLDVATGTGDLAFVLSEIKGLSISGLDLSPEMIRIAQKKAKDKNKDIQFIEGDSESLPFQDEVFDYVTVAFGVRNFEDLLLGLREIRRVLKNEGKVYILEFSVPGPFFFRVMYNFYSKHILPVAASVFGGERRAYTYLPESISSFPYGEEMLNLLERAGFSSSNYQLLSEGIASIYTGKKQIIK